MGWWMIITLEPDNTNSLYSVAAKIWLAGDAATPFELTVRVHTLNTYHSTLIATPNSLPLFAKSNCHYKKLYL